jgi:CheY-like chemotaxis protein
MYKRLEQSNVVLELAVQERTQELEEQTKIAVQASKAKSDFLAIMSHEIRSPLNAVIGLSEIELHSPLSESSRNNITQILHSGSTLLGIINDILDISKIEARAFQLVPVEYDTASFINDTVNLNRVIIGSKPINFVLEINDDFPGKLIGDEVRVKQILNNILSNAVKYTMEGKVTLRVENKNFSQGQERRAFLRFIVRDTGIGMRKEDVKKLFSCYTQLDAQTDRKIEGTGLGLEITKNLVEMMSGTITVESEYGKGSVFTVTLMQGIPDYHPKSKLDIPPGIGEKTARDLRNFCYVASNKDTAIIRSWMPYGKVLVVDDMPVNTQVTQGLLKLYGLKVDSAASGQEAIDMVQAADTPYNLVFMDQMMPEMDGIEATRIIREWEEEQGKQKIYTRLLGYTRIPIIALTANALKGNMEMLLSNGIDDYIPKPINFVQLDEVLNRWIRNKQTRETLRQAERDKQKKVQNEGY